MCVFSGAPGCTRATDNANLFWLHLRSMDEDVEPPASSDAEPQRKQRKKGDRSGPSGRSGKSNWANAKRQRRKSPVSTQEVQQPAAIPETPPEAFEASKNEEVTRCNVETQTPSWVRRVRLVSPLDTAKDISMSIGF